MRKFCKAKLFSFGLLLCVIFVLVRFHADLCLQKTCSHVTTGKNEDTSYKKMVTSQDSGVATETNMAVLCHPQPRKHTNCKKLYKGENTTISTNSRRIPEKCRLENIARDCTLLRLAHGYGQSPVTQQEVDLPIAFSIKIHTNPGQVEQLLRTIYRPHNVYCIHVDKRADSTLHQIISQISRCFNNVHVIPNPMDLIYASSAHVRVELQLMKLCLDRHSSWKYYINLAGQDFPLKTNLEMVEILQQLKGQNDIESFFLSRFKRKQLLRKVKIDGNRVTATNRTKESFQYDVQLRKGSTYGLFSRTFVEFLLADDVAQLFLNWSRDITPSEEIVWPTLNSLPWAPGGYDVEIRHVDGYHLAKAVLWSLDSNSCQGKLVRSVCVFGSRDLPWLKDRHELFANKFNDEFDPVPLDCLEDSLHQRTVSQDTTKLQWFRYRHLRQVLNDRFEKFTSKASSIVEYLAAEKQKWLQKHHPSVT